MGSQISKQSLGIIRLLPQASFKHCPSKHHLGCIATPDATVLVKRTDTWQSPASNIAVDVSSCAFCASQSYTWPKKPEAPSICFTSSSCPDISRRGVHLDVFSRRRYTRWAQGARATHTRWTWWRMLDASFRRDIWFDTFFTSHGASHGMSSAGMLVGALWA